MTLEKLGLLARDGGETYHETYAAGQVCAQNIKDREVEAGTEIILTMSRGSRYVNLGDGALLGLTQSEARAKLEGMGLVCQYGGSVTDETYGEGKVCKQSASGKLERGTVVTITISEGSRYTTVASMRNMSRSEASTYLNAVSYTHLLIDFLLGEYMQNLYYVQNYDALPLNRTSLIQYQET